MFLKRIELSGFKSFANKTVILFDQPMTGIVGPNGCGKSNITDAIRWVLGEQSAKSLRSGDSVSDMIFAGSQTRKPVNMAKATLVFDNTDGVFDSPYEEIEITRQISRGSGEVSNFINKTPCRLKDIQDLVMDTGLGRDSLSIISQGNVSAFADARPEERRSLFEEAAGVAKYKKRKKISLSKLDAVSANLERVADLIEANSGQLETLRRQAAKAKEYMEAKNALSDIEISLLAVRIEELKSEEVRLEQELTGMKEQIVSLNLASEKADQQSDALSAAMIEADAKLSAAQRELSQVMEETMRLQKQKAVLDERRKISLSSEDEEERRQSLMALYSEARFEVEDRRKRMNALQLEIEDAGRIIERAQNEGRNLQIQKNRLQSAQEELSRKLYGVESRIANPPYKNHGVQAVMNHQNQLPGIHGLVQNLLECENEYLPAISTALASAAEQIVVSDERCAREAIGWLKRSQAGRATFLPLTVCKRRSLAEWQRPIAQSSPGILGTADQFVVCDPQYDLLKSRLLGSILIAKDLESANRAARALKQTVKIVTIAGDVVHAGGAMTGGSSKGPSNPLPALKAEKARLEAQIDEMQSEIDALEEKISTIQNETAILENAQLQRRIDREKLDNILTVKKEKFDSLQAQIAQLDLSAKEKELEAQQEPLIERLSYLHARQDELNSTITLLSERKRNQNEQRSELQESLRKIRRELNALTSASQKDEIELTKVQTRLEQDLSRLSQDYSLTYEAASLHKKEINRDEAEQTVKTLRKKIQSLGAVNLEAPEELEKVQEKVDFLSSQKEELEQAARQILEAVDEMDQTMISQFKEMFDKINSCLDEVFKAMFGGGKARLVLVDPNDLLNTGVDVDVTPPGKSVKNLSTFSGGEKALIAISVLFAILKARTVPLCIFDEAEAALDQANVERFARYLKEHRDQSQFITVTHRPGTMEQCDTLYGITMQKDGVSQVLKVQLTDAAEMSR